MPQSFKEAVSICKAIMRNGIDAYIVNSNLQYELADDDAPMVIDIATEADFAELTRIFPEATASTAEAAFACLEQAGISFYFYPTDVAASSNPEEVLMRITPRMLDKLRTSNTISSVLANPFAPLTDEAQRNEFEDFASGEVRLRGLPEFTLRLDYLLAIRAMRYAANFELPIEANTWSAIVRAVPDMASYIPVIDLMREWRLVAAENMWRFVELLHESQLLHTFLPEIAALSRVKQTRSVETGQEERVLAHTIACMRHYPEEEFHYDWYGTFAMLFHDVGKLYTAEFFNNRWLFYQHHRVGEKITRKLLRRLHMLPEDTDLICHLVRHHMRFHFMLTDRGIRRFKSLEDYPRLIEMARADIKARDLNYTAFNHNMKYLDRAETPEQMLEPLLNGKEIMEYANLSPGPQVGAIRDALLQAQIAGEVTAQEEAVAFVQHYSSHA